MRAPWGRGALVGAGLLIALAAPSSPAALARARGEPAHQAAGASAHKRKHRSAKAGGGKHAKRHNRRAHKHPKRKKHATTKPRSRTLPFGREVEVESGTITMTLSPAVLARLNQALVFAKPAPIALAATPPATSPSAGMISFPVTEGSVNTGTGFGSVRAAGGFTLTQRSEGMPGSVTTVSLGYGGPDAAVLEAPTPIFTATVNEVTNRALLSLSLQAIKPTIEGRTITIADVPARLTESGAQELSHFSGAELSTAEEFATVTIVAVA
jgi:hypothetical protein